MKKFFIKLIRKIGLIKFVDKIRFYFYLVKTYKSRQEFKKNHPNAILPPSYFLYETFNLNYSSYHNSKKNAIQLIEVLKRFKEFKNIKILDWGCGPGRYISHLPRLIDDSCECYGTDYNKKYIKWCKNNIQNVTFTVNRLHPPMEYQSNFFDIVYCNSIFTHLSEEMHFAWFNELIRILKPQGILYITLQGSSFIKKLSNIEEKQFAEGKLVIRGNTKEGHRTYAAFHPESFVRKLIGNNNVLAHIPGEVNENKPQQDIWIIEKNRLN